MKGKIKERFKKIIISLATSIILFSSVFTVKVQAVSLGGILFKPISQFIAICIASVDITLGSFLNGDSANIDKLDEIMDKLKDQDTSGISDDIIVGPDTIFRGDIDILNANIFKKSSSETSSWWGGITLGEQLRNMVSGIYVILRNICAIILLIGLIISGIKILISTNRVNDRAQWLMILQDWVVGLALLVFSHIIMTTVFYISDTLAGALSGALGNANFTKTLLKECFGSWDGAKQVIYLIMLAWLLYLTIIFTLTYFRRLFYISILTILAPVTSVMYAFGRGTKQIYQNWFKDYCMTVFIQPIHIVMYYVLITIPIGIASTTTTDTSQIFRLVYALIAVFFIKKFENLINELFGLNKGIVATVSADAGRKDMSKISEGIKAAFTKIALAVATGGAALATRSALAKAGTEAVAAGAGAEGEAVAAGAEGEAAGEGLGATDNSLETPKPTYNPNLTEDQIDEMKAEGIEPGDQEYRQYLNNFGVKMTDEEVQLEKDKLNPKKEDIKADKNQESNTNNSTNEKQGSISNNTSSNDKMGQGLNLDNVSTINLNGNPTINSNSENESEDENKLDDLKDTLEDTEEKDNDGKKDEIDNAELENALKDQGKSKVRILLEKGARAAKDTHEFLNAPKYKEQDAKIMDSLKGLSDNAYATIGGGVGNRADDSLYKSFKGDYDEKNKKKKEKIHNNFTNNEGNINYIIQKENMMEKLRQQYPKKDPGEIREMAETKAKSKLEKMTPYVDMGLKNIDAIYNIHSVQKEKGLSPEEAIINVRNGMKAEKRFNAFDKNSNNVQYINQKYQINVSKVSDKIKNASEISLEGVQNIEKMDRVSQIQQETGLNTHLSVVAEKALGRVEQKGEKIVLPKGSSPELRRVVEQLNNMNFR